MKRLRPSVFAFSEAGGHPANEDSFDVHAHPNDDLCEIVALGDGVGGQPGGGRAARFATHAALLAASTRLPDDLLAPSVWGPILRQVDHDTAADAETGLTTLIGLAVKGNKVAGASAGDSAVFVLDASGKGQELTQYQAKKPWVGTGEATFATFGADLVPPWQVVVMSDGVWKYAGWERVRALAAEHRGQALIDALHKAVLLPGSGGLQDDFTVIVVHSPD